MPFPGNNIFNKHATVLLNRVNQIETTPKLPRNQSEGKHKKSFSKTSFENIKNAHKNTATQTWILTTESVIQKKVSWGDEESDYRHWVSREALFLNNKYKY